MTHNQCLSWQNCKASANTSTRLSGVRKNDRVSGPIGGTKGRGLTAHAMSGTGITERILETIGNGGAGCIGN